MKMVHLLKMGNGEGGEVKGYKIPSKMYSSFLCFELMAFLSPFCD